MWEMVLKLEREVTKPIVIFALGLLVAQFVKWDWFGWAANLFLAEAGLPWVCIVLLIFLALSRITRLRIVSGTLLVLSAYLFAITAWLFSVKFTHEQLGWLVLSVGLLFKGGGVFLIAPLLFALMGMWSEALRLVAVTVVAYGARRLGLYLVQNVGDWKPGSTGKPWDNLRPWWLKTPLPGDKQGQI